MSQGGAGKTSEDDGEEHDNLLINVIEEGNSMLQSLQILNLQPQVCLRDRLSEGGVRPINLYHKVGHGKLDMYVINPSRDAKELREFMERWNGENSKVIRNRIQMVKENNCSTVDFGIPTVVCLITGPYDYSAHLPRRNFTLF